MIISKCRVKAGKVVGGVQGNDAIDISGTANYPSDLNDIDEIDVTITSLADDAVIYEETIDFNASVANETGKFKHSYKIPSGSEGAITSMKLDFVKGTFAIKAKNIDLTGLASPLQLDLAMGATTLTGEADEDVINNSRKTIPTRLMRTYQDTLIVTKAKVRASDVAASDSLSVKGDIAVIDVEDANLVNAGLVIYWADDSEITTQTITVPAEYFVPAKSGNVYKCSKAPADEGGLVSGKFDLDKCMFNLSVKGTDLGVTTGDVKFGLTISAFDEVDDVNLVLGY
jgi:hypothetical protein